MFQVFLFVLVALLQNAKILSLSYTPTPSKIMLEQVMLSEWMFYFHTQPKWVILHLHEWCFPYFMKLEDSQVAQHFCRWRVFFARLYPAPPASVIWVFPSGRSQFKTCWYSVWPHLEIIYWGFFGFWFFWFFVVVVVALTMVVLAKYDIVIYFSYFLSFV